MTVLRKEDPSLFGFKTSVLALGIIDAQSALLCGKDTLLLPNDELILTGHPSEIRAAGGQTGPMVEVKQDGSSVQEEEEESV